VHAGFSRYFTPPPFELIATTSINEFIGTTAQAAILEDTAPFGERDNYYDLGVQQKLLDDGLTLGVDSFYKQAQHLIDEGQFGAPIVLTPFMPRTASSGSRPSATSIPALAVLTAAYRAWAPLRPLATKR